MLRVPKTLAALFLAVTLAQAADPVVEGKKTAEWLVELKVKNVEAGSAVLYDFYHQETGRRIGKAKSIPISREVVFAGPKGKYDVLIRVVKGEDVFELNEVVEITGGQQPEPPLPPGPKPPPDPTPDPARKDVSYRIVFVEETSLAAGERGSFLTNKSLDARMKAKGHNIRIVDKDVKGQDGSVPKDLTDILAEAASKPYPQVFLVDKAGKHKTVRFDASKLDVPALLKILDSNGG